MPYVTLGNSGGPFAIFDDIAGYFDNFRIANDIVRASGKDATGKPRVSFDQALEQARRDRAVTDRMNAVDRARENAGLSDTAKIAIAIAGVAGLALLLRSR